MNNEFDDVIHNLVLENAMPAKDLAKAIGKPYSTLLREVNPYDTGAKLGAETLFAIMLTTGNVKPIEYMSSRLGLELSPINSDVPHVIPGALSQNMNMSDMQGVEVCPTCGSRHYSAVALSDATGVRTRV